MSERAIFPLREWTAHTGAECTYPHSFTNTMIVACLPIHVLFASPLYPPLPWLETRPHFAVTSCTSLSTHAAVPHLLWPVPRGLHDRLIPPCALMTHPSVCVDDAPFPLHPSASLARLRCSYNQHAHSCLLYTQPLAAARGARAAMAHCQGCSNQRLACRRRVGWGMGRMGSVGTLALQHGVPAVAGVAVIGAACSC